MTSKFFDEFEVGEEHKTRCMSLSEGQIMDFAMTYDPQHMHVDHERSKGGPFGGIIASGFQTLSLAFRLFYDLGLVAETNIIGLGYDKIRWKKPLYPGESIYVVCKVIEMKASSSKPDRGILTWEFLTYNTKDELVMSNEGTMMVRRKITN
ncbi:MaoC/PaaZ C-terminal domain-containing protein [Curvivirga aplysinae]|uniref:MaoC/PaaZ C-terminal domain-containing protein n=1 Tax=Curvivirga aplysinae TaxID=2529852 RepID=UPI0012BC90B6|nr:MaoC/PaaZ C-terminal domain-containing protein [Curvivirga aplysinae]MTI10429.1 acyl dehydratase [Curvivirga aplysinae]